MKKAFTMLELVFVIVIIGILAAVIIPRTGSNKLAEAAVQVVSHIQYTQHLAMVDDQFIDGNNTWFRGRWQIFFQLDNSGNQNRVYTIYSDNDLDSTLPENGELALDPLTKQQMTGNSFFGNNRIESMDLTATYGINNVDTTICGSNRIVFDHLGRPHTDDNNLYNDLLTIRCEIILFSTEGNISIFIEPETGYAHL